MLKYSDIIVLKLNGTFLGPDITVVIKFMLFAILIIIVRCNYTIVCLLIKCRTKS